MVTTMGAGGWVVVTLVWVLRLVVSRVRPRRRRPTAAANRNSRSRQQARASRSPGRCLGVPGAVERRCPPRTHPQLADEQNGGAVKIERRIGTHVKMMVPKLAKAAGFVIVDSTWGTIQPLEVAPGVRTVAELDVI